MKTLLKNILLLILILFLPVSSVHPDMTISAISIVGDISPDLEQKIRHFIPFTASTPVTEEQVQETVSEIKGLNLFKDISYTLTPASQGTQQLTITLNQAPKVRKLSVHGNYPLLGKNITKLIVLQPGTVFDESKIEESIQSIRDYLTKYGYYNSDVKIEFALNNKYNVIDLSIRLKKGQSYKIDKINIQGNTVFTQSRLQHKLSHWGHFKTKQLQSDVKTIKKMYAHKGYIKARVDVDSIVFHDDTQSVDLVLTLEENKKLKLDFSGQPLFSERHLKDVVALEERRSYDRFAVNQGQDKLINYYQKKGFPEPAVQVNMTKPSDSTVAVIYTINKGDRVALNEIKFDKNHEVGAKKLKKVMMSRESGFLSRGFFDEQLLNNDRARLEQAYLDRGFFDVQVDLPKFETNKHGNQLTAIYPVTEGLQYNISDVTIQSGDTLEAQTLIKKSDLSIGKSFNAEKLRKAKIRILDFLQTQGHAYASVETTLEKDASQHTVKISFQISLGPIVHVRSITLDGTMITHNKTILNNIKIKSGDLFIYQKLLDAQLNLRKLGIFSSVKMTPLGFEAQSDQIDLLVSVIERKSISVNVRGGFDSRYLATGEVNLTKYNLFGSGRQLSLRAIGGPEYDRGELTFFSPRVFGASWNLTNQYFGEYQAEPYYTSSSYGGLVSTLKKFGPHWTFGFREQITRTDLYESESDLTALGNSLYDNTLNEFQLTASYDRRDNYADPQKGVFVLASNEINTSLSDLSSNFDVLEINASHYLGFLKRFTLITTVRAADIMDVASHPIIPANKLFFLGGADTLRGFGEDAVNPSGGTVMGLYNGELQFRVTNAIKIAGFFDAGFLANSLDSIGMSDIRESAGFGLRYITPIGPLRLDWAFILDRQAGEPINKIHFSFGYFF